MSHTTPLPPFETDDGTFVYTQGKVHDVARDIIKAQAGDDAFYVCDVRDIVAKVDLWREALPRVAPYYAIKSCRDPVVLNVLSSLGVNFDCSNKLEIATVLDIGVSPDRIVYANTVKSTSHLQYAQDHGVNLMTFDCAEELAKIKDKNAKLLLRIEADETGSQHSFNSKFGCSFNEARRLLHLASDMGCNVIGVSFHVGCAYQSPEIFTRTFDRARAVFDTAANLGNHMSVLDVGGGFPGGLRNRDKFLKVCDSIRIATDRHFPSSSGVELIAEPGQFFVTSSYALVTRVLGKRRREILIDGTSHVHQDVFINETKDNCISRNLYDYLDVKTWPLEEPLERPRDVLTTVWGATCNPEDCIESRRLHFDVRVDEWLLMDNLGAYSLSRASGFNGFPFPVVHYIAPSEAAAFILGILDRSPLKSGYGQPETVLKRTASANVATSDEEHRGNAGAGDTAASVFTRSHVGLAFHEGTL